MQITRISESYSKSSWYYWYWYNISMDIQETLLSVLDGLVTLRR